MKIGLAQINPIKGNVQKNISIHKKYIQFAIDKKLNAIFFSELSITGYEPALANELAIYQDDIRFNDFQQISDQENITIGIGVPIKKVSGVLISMLIFQPNLPRQIYSKQMLHEDERPYFIEENEQILINIGHLKIAPAICYESLQNSHIDEAMDIGANIYLASVAKPQSGIDKAMLHYPVIAKKYTVPILMSNCFGYCDNFEAIGTSSIWNKKGELLASLDKSAEGVLIYDTELDEV